GVTPDYYQFVRWRLLQRFVSAMLYCLCTQSLLLGLGLKSDRRGALALGAAANWILKDALGKVARILWASRMGRKFDSDPKRWRYRGTLLYALGNALEIVTFVFPNLFLLFATGGNTLKQVSMLTSSSTRNTIYNSFKGPGKENIGDITAKGEAQVAVVDLVGISIGMVLAKFLGTNLPRVLSAWVVLQCVDSFLNYKEIKAVVFRSLNFEKLWNIAERYVEDDEGVITLTPEESAQRERIFRPPTHLCRRAIAFGSLGRSSLCPAEVETLLEVFRGERYLLVVGEDVKNRRRNKQRLRRKSSAVRIADRLQSNLGPADKTRRALEALREQKKENCHVVLHADATNRDIVKATIALACLRRELANSAAEGPLTVANSLAIIESAKEEADGRLDAFLGQLENKGWRAEKFMFGKIGLRCAWPLDNVDHNS
ncbi:hypothetical protein TeGR_g11482, partial [Tetraparma gracilis]